MATQNYFSHTSADGRTLADRINATGYAWSALGENIAAGYPSVNAVVDGWMASDGHCSEPDEPGLPRHRVRLRRRHVDAAPTARTGRSISANRAEEHALRAGRRIACVASAVAAAYS